MLDTKVLKSLISMLIYFRPNRRRWRISWIWKGVKILSAKNRDNHNRWRSKTIAFRVSPEENEQIERYVQLSGLTKQDYITRRLTHRDIVVQGSPRVFKALRNQLADVLAELQRIEAESCIDDELLDVIEMIAVILGGLKGEEQNE